MKKHLKEHLFYKKKSIGAKKDLEDAKQEMDPGMYEIFCEAVKRVFKKWTSLYEAALQSPEAYNELNRQCSMGQGSFKGLEKGVNSGCLDELTCKYVEAMKFITYADKWYTDECDFSERIASLAASIAVFIDSEVAKQKHLQIHLKEVNENWKKDYSEQSKSDGKSEEPPRKRLRKDEQNEERTTDEQEKSVSWKFPR